jgi:hypothetical protein
MKTDRILIPLDGSDTAEAAIAEARQVARADSTFLFVRACSFGRRTRGSSRAPT